MIAKGKKGFTLVELVIVIAVIAILAAVLIPTFSTVIDKANQSVDVQSARNMSSIAKAAAINGAVGEDGRVYDMNYTPDVVDYLKSQNFTLVPKSKNTSFWYDRATGDISINKNDEMFTNVTNGAFVDNGATLAIGAGGVTYRANTIGQAEDSFTQDCPEALLKDKANLVFIDQSPTNPITKAIDTIYNLADTTSQTDYNAITSAMDTKFTSAITNNADLQKIFKLKDGGYVASYNYLTGTYSPKNCYYMTNNGGYTAKTANDSVKLQAAVVQKGTTTIGKYQGTDNLTLTFEDTVKVNVPKSVTDFVQGAFTNFDAKATIVINNNYDGETLKKLATGATVINNTGAIQISYKTLRFGEFTYAQYGQRYIDINNANKNVMYSQVKDLAGKTVSDESLKAVTGTTFSAKSVYAIPKINVKSPDENGMIVWDETKNEMTFQANIYSKNISNLTVLYGSIITTDMTYKIQDVAYIKYVTTYSANTDTDMYFYVSDPTNGAYYYNLDGIKVYAYYDGGESNGTEMFKETSGAMKGDYKLDDANKTVTKIIVKDSKGNTLLVQYMN